MKGADYCIYGGKLLRHTGCHWHRSSRDLHAQPKASNMELHMYLYAGPESTYLLRRKDSFLSRRANATALIAEGPLRDMWRQFLTYGEMVSCESS